MCVTRGDKREAHAFGPLYSRAAAAGVTHMKLSVPRYESFPDRCDVQYMREERARHSLSFDIGGGGARVRGPLTPRRW